MASVNIGGGDDQFNRYKMPSVIAKVEGRGNGIKTRIVNCYEVARALHRPPGYVCKFFGCELGAQTKIDDNEGIYIVNGSFQQNVLQDVLKKFIDMFVLCPSCGLPETDLKLRKNVRKTVSINQACNACGHEGPCDMTHKLCTFILNNPPDGKKKKTDGKKDKAARRAAKAKKMAANGQSKDDSDEAIDATSGTTTAAADEDNSTKRGSSGGKSSKKTSNSKKNGKKGVEQQQEEEEMEEQVGLIGDFDLMKSAIDGVDCMNGFSNDIGVSNGFGNGHDDINTSHDNQDDDDVEWSVDTSKEAEEARKRELGAAASILEYQAPTTVNGHHGNGSSGDGGMMTSSYDGDRAMKLRAYIDDGKRPSKVLSKAEKIFGEEDAIRGLMVAATHDEVLAAIPGSVTKRAVPVFQYLGEPMNAGAQAAFFKYLDWAGTEGESRQKMLQVLPHILKAMYDADVLEEAEIMKWFNDSSGPKEVRKAVQVIIDWLKDDGDDEEDDDDEDEDEDDDDDE